MVFKRRLDDRKLVIQDGQKRLDYHLRKIRWIEKPYILRIHKQPVELKGLHFIHGRRCAAQSVSGDFDYSSPWIDVSRLLVEINEAWKIKVGPSDPTILPKCKSQTNFLQTALMQACRYGHWEVVQALLLFRCNWLQQVTRAGTALHFAAVNGHGESTYSSEHCGDNPYFCKFAT